MASRNNMSRQSLARRTESRQFLKKYSAPKLPELKTGIDETTEVTTIEEDRYKPVEGINIRSLLDSPASRVTYWTNGKVKSIEHMYGVDNFNSAFLRTVEYREQLPGKLPKAMDVLTFDSNGNVTDRKHYGYGRLPHGATKVYKFYKAYDYDYSAGWRTKVTAFNVDGSKYATDYYSYGKMVGQDFKGRKDSDRKDELFKDYGWVKRKDKFGNVISDWIGPNDSSYGDIIKSGNYVGGGKKLTAPPKSVNKKIIRTPKYYIGNELVTQDRYNQEVKKRSITIKKVEPTYISIPIAKRIGMDRIPRLNEKIIVALARARGVQKAIIEKELKAGKPITSKKEEKIIQKEQKKELQEVKKQEGLAGAMQKAKKLSQQNIMQIERSRSPAEKIFRGVAVAGILGGIRGGLGVVSAITSPFQFVKSNVQALTQPLKTLRVMGEELKIDPVGTVFEYLTFSKGLKLVGSQAKKSPVGRYVQEELYIRSMPKELRTPVREIIKGAKAQEKLNPFNIKSIKSADFLEVKSINKIEAEALQKTLRKTDSVVFGSLPARTLSKKRTPLPKDVDLATKDIKTFYNEFKKNLPKEYRTKYILKGEKIIRKSNKEALFDVKPLDRLYPGRSIFSKKGYLPVSGFVTVLEKKKGSVLPRLKRKPSLASLEIPTQKTVKVKGIKITSFGEQTTRKGLGTLQVLIEKNFKRAKDPRSFLVSLEVQLQGLLKRRPKNKVSLSLWKNKVSKIRAAIKLLKSKSFQRLLEKKVPGLTKEFPLVSKINTNKLKKIKLREVAKEVKNKLKKKKIIASKEKKKKTAQTKTKRPSTTKEKIVKEKSQSRLPKKRKSILPKKRLSRLPSSRLKSKIPSKLPKSSRLKRKPSKLSKSSRLKRKPSKVPKSSKLKIVSKLPTPSKLKKPVTSKIPSKLKKPKVSKLPKKVRKSRISKLPKTPNKSLPLPKPKKQIRYKLKKDDEKKKQDKIIGKVIKSKKFIYIPDLYSILYNVKASKAEKAKFLKKGAIFSGITIRKLVR